MSNRTQPLEVAPESMVSIRLVRALTSAVESAGVAKSSLLCAAQLSDDAADNDDARISRACFYRLCESAIHLTGDPALGLHWNERLDAVALNPVAHLVVHAPTLRHGFEALSRYHRLFADWHSFVLEEGDDTVLVRCLPLPAESPRIQRLVGEMVAAGVVRLVRQFSPHARPRSVSFEYAAPSYQSEYARIFQGAECFDQPYTGVTFDRALMSAPSPHKDDEVHGALRSVAEQRMLRLIQRTPYAVRVRERLVTQGATPRISMATVARELGLSVRSLRRRLEAEGTTYNSVVNESLGIVAKQLMRNTTGSVQEIAFAMGFADTSSFHRAFKRWTGTTPRGYRTEQLAQRSF